MIPLAPAAAIYFKSKPPFLTHAHFVIYREAVLRGFNSPDDFVVKQGSLNYTDGASYQVRGLQ